LAPDTSAPSSCAPGSGFLAALRISNTAHYSADFTPSKTLKSDARIVLLYDLSLTKDGRLQDRSVHGRHGTIHGARWILHAGPVKAAWPKAPRTK
jgi:hypothetical protein